MKHDFKKSERCRQRLFKAIDEDKSYDEKMMRLNKLFKALEKENDVEIFDSDVSKFGYGFIDALEDLCKLFKEENALHRHMHEDVWKIIGMIDVYGENQRKKLAQNLQG